MRNLQCISMCILARSGKSVFVGVLLLMSAAFSSAPSQAQYQPPIPEGGLSTKATFMPLGPIYNAVLVEPVTPNEKSRIAVLITHPEHLNNFNYFTGWELPKYGYRAMMLNYYGREQTYYEFIEPIAAAIKALRAIPGVEKVVLVGHSTGGAELTSYEDVAENGATACQDPERIYKCDGKGLDNLPKADGVIAFDVNVGAPEKTMALDPAVDAHFPRVHNPDLDIFNPKNGFDPATKSAHYSQEFLNRFFAAQAAKANLVIDQALDRQKKLDRNEGDYKDDEPFVVAGASVNLNGARPELADLRLLSKTHSPHMLLKGDGTKPVGIIPVVMSPVAVPEQSDSLFLTTMNTTVRHYLSFQALRVTPDYRETEDNILGVKWRSTPNSFEGNVAGIKIPTLIIAGTCSQHVVLLEIAYDLSAAKDKEFVGVEGANHFFLPCKPEYGDTFKRAFDYADSWLSKPGRF